MKGTMQWINWTQFDGMPEQLPFGRARKARNYLLLYSNISQTRLPREIKH